MRAGDHKHSSLVYFYHTGIGKSDTTNGQGWKIRTLSTLLKDIGDSNVSLGYIHIKTECTRVEQHNKNKTPDKCQQKTWMICLYVNNFLPFKVNIW